MNELISGSPLTIATTARKMSNKISVTKYSTKDSKKMICNWIDFHFQDQHLYVQVSLHKNTTSHHFGNTCMKMVSEMGD
jgi:hypothetical protein